MPFIGRDWRSPGEAWVKTESLGWQRMKIIESQLSPGCHQQSPACSWPPRSEYGQHMDDNCGRNTDTLADPRIVTGEPAMRTSLLSDLDTTSSSSASSSPGSSRNGSVSPSPSGSPEKNTHHIHPIAISSPYGLHAVANASANCCTRANHHHNHYHHHHHQHNHQSTMSRSLSKESLVSSNSNLGTPRKTLMMRYNRSVSDFRDAPDCQQLPPLPTTSGRGDKDGTKSQQEKTNGCVCSTSPPTLMKNGQRIDDLTDGDDSHVTVDQRQRSSSETATRFGAELADKQQQQLCCCCCCCSTCSSTGVAGGSPCNFYALREPGGTKTAPHCRISVRTREVAMYNTISEAFYRLDFCNAIHDIRRFNYICKLLHLLITQNLTSLSGCATRVLFSMLEQVAWEVSNNKRNIHILKNLLKELRLMIEKYYCWGRPIGSSLLWQQHFETIERISAIVDGIELEPPKGSGDQASWNDLPVEMIREILLRLNDYRDLVNSAQASPVMQIMIDNQYIWQKLCKYHFTEQQLKLALENRVNYLSRSSMKQRTNNVQGIKYARTVSADGRSSYRNPVVNPTSESSNPTSATASTKKKEGQSSSPVTASTSRQKRSQTSYVTRAIRIFDRDGSSATLGTSLINNHDSSSTTTASRRQSRPTSNDRSSLSSSDANKQVVGSPTAATNSSSAHSPSMSGRDIDWERVFHQLRKKFGLKEEYPDCLLLCRHCRCLFWKSFGHPCIKTDDIRLTTGSSCNPALARPADNQTDRAAQVAAQNGRQQPGAGDSPVGGDNRRSRTSRPSVADLSRTFSRDAENTRPATRRNSGLRANNDNRPLSANLDAAQLLQGRARPVLNHLRENNNNNNLPPRNQSSSARDELIPKHVAISPQAFLKFFSL